MQRGREGWGVKKLPILLSKRLTKWEGGGHKIQKMGQHCLWMTLYNIIVFQSLRKDKKKMESLSDDYIVGLANKVLEIF